jgi:hypothetical protein
VACEVPSGLDDLAVLQRKYKKLSASILILTVRNSNLVKKPLISERLLFGS